MNLELEKDRTRTFSDWLDLANLEDESERCGEYIEFSLLDLASSFKFWLLSLMGKSLPKTLSAINSLEWSFNDSSDTDNSFLP